MPRNVDTKIKTTEVGSVVVNGTKITVSVHQNLTQEVVVSSDCKICEDDLLCLIDNVQLKKLVDKAKIVQYNAKIALGDIPD